MYGGEERWWGEPRERPGRRWEDNIKMHIQEVGWGYGLDLAGSG